MRERFERAPITYTLIAINVLVYIYTSLRYGMSMSVYGGISAGAFNPELVLGYHEYYRLLSANFIHFGIMHIVVNMYSFEGLGSFMEHFLKPIHYVLVIFFSALATTLLPLAAYLVNGFGASSICAGFSGVIFGLIGALGTLALLYRNIFEDVFRSLIPNILMMAVISLLIPSISFSGHLSGMIGGFVSAYVIMKLSKRRHSRLIH